MNILLVKLSSLGDVLHAMAAVQDIVRALPDARIDWVVERAFAPLVQRCAGVQRVIACDLRRWRRSIWRRSTRVAWRDFKAELQRQPYDAVIDLQGLSKSALVAWLARCSPTGKRFAMANQTDGSSYEAPTRWVADVALRVSPHSHAVARARELCALALGYTSPEQLSFGLAADRSKPAADAGNDGAKRVVALLHGSSRADKGWPPANWIELGRCLNAAGWRVALAHGNDEEQRQATQIAAALDDAMVWPRLPLDALADALASCAGAVGVDSGLSHLAVALGLPHVQIYNFDTAWRTGPISAIKQRSVFGLPSPSVDAVWQAWQAVSEMIKAT